MCKRKLACLLLIAAAALHTACGGGANAGPPPPPPPPQVTVSVSPTSASPRAGETVQFTATVTGTSNTAVTWSVNGDPLGNPTIGTMNPSGFYTAPPTLPNPNTVTITATSVAAPAAAGNATATLLNPIPVVTGVSPTVAGTGIFLLAVTGDKFVQGAQIQFGGVTLSTTYVSSTQLIAVANAPAQAGNVQVTVTNPNPGSVVSTTSASVQVVTGTQVSASAAARFLEQATFGPTPWLINQVQQVGFTNFLNDQFNAPASTFPDQDPADDSPSILQRTFFVNALYFPDQLRQRMAFSLHKIWVVSWVTVSEPEAFAPYLRMHMNHAFSNYRQIMENVTLNPAMGRYQDVANNDKPNPALGISSNENYGRELMQLFTVGVWKLNPDGTLQLDGSGNPIATYDQAVVEDNARAMSGWTYPVRPGGSSRWPRPPYYVGVLEADEAHHDLTSKVLLDGFVLPAGQNTATDLRGVLDNLFNNQNIAPHVSKLLIQQFVTSNPSPAYVQRVASVFASGTFQGWGSGQRGDMKALIAAILLDPEARAGDDPAVVNANFGKLKEPVLLMTNLFRAFSVTSDGGRSINDTRNMGQWLLYPPTVFSYFSPENLIQGSTLLGPEFQIHTTATALVRVNFINTFAFGNLGSGTTVDFTPFANLSANPDAPGQLLDTLNTLLLHGTMSSSMRASVLNAVNAVSSTNPDRRARTAIYLIASSSQYNVQR